MERRRLMVAQVREGLGLRAVARRFRVSLSTVQRWVARAGDQPLDKVDWSEQPPGAQSSSRRTVARVEDRVLKVRQQLQTKSALGEYGAAAIRRELERQQVRNLPALRTIGRILERRGALDGRRRMRHHSPPPGWYLPEVSARRVELDSFDIIEDLVIRGGHDVNVLTGIALHGGLCAAWPAEQITAKFTVEALVAHWRECGLPGYVKFDNDTVFQGAHQWPDTFGRVTRTCLSLGVTPVFAPPLSRGFQADIEAFNRRWQEAVWTRFTFRHRKDVQTQSARFVQAHRARHAVRIEDAPARTSFPACWRPDLQRPLTDTVIFVRVTNAAGQATVLGHTYDVSPLWSGRLVRADVDLTQHQMRFHALRRKDPHNHVLLATHAYQPPTTRFHE
ncbi:MAG: helix-turn-helix domain-containing protein [Actinobacteria bacterium]|nr:helix-turn-helix domain-containing protein [Actinomycetota bacterium]